MTPVLSWVREKARKDSKGKFAALFHHLDPNRLRTAFERLNRSAAAGADGEIWEEFGKHREERIKSIYERLQAGAYRPQPARRVHIPKPDGRQRPLGIASLEERRKPRG